MSNPLQTLINLIGKKKNYRIGTIIESTGSIHKIRCIDGSIFTVTGTGYAEGNSVLAEGEIIISKISEQMKEVWVK